MYGHCVFGQDWQLSLVRNGLGQAAIVAASVAERVCSVEFTSCFQLTLPVMGWVFGPLQWHDTSQSGCARAIIFCVTLLAQVAQALLAPCCSMG
jgi:hypothetical protein